MRYIYQIFMAILILANGLYAQRWAYVINANSETLSRVNLQTGVVENHIVNTGPVPNQIAYYEGILYVVNSGSASLQIIDAENSRTIGEIPLPLNSNPLNVAFDGQFAFITGFATARVYKIDIINRILIDSFTVGLSPSGIEVFNGKLYVANTAFNQIDYTFGQGSVSVIDLSTEHQITQINVGKNPQAMAVAPDSVINVICTGNYSSIRGRVYFIDSRTNAVADSLITGGDPFWPCIGSAGIAYVTAGGWSGHGVVFSYNAITRTIIRGTANPIQVGIGAMGLAMDSSGNLYSTGQLANAVTCFNSQGQVLATFPVGSGPVSVAIIDQRTSIDDSNNNIPVGVSLGRPYPNPFNSTIIIPLQSPGENCEAYKINIYDINGRLIRQLALDIDNSINNRLIWAGDDFYGKPAASGVYFAKLMGTTAYVKMVLIR